MDDFDEQDSDELIDELLMAVYHCQEFMQENGLTESMFQDYMNRVNNITIH